MSAPTLAPPDGAPPVPDPYDPGPDDPDPHATDPHATDHSDERARRREDALALLDGVRLARSRGSGRAGRALRQAAVHLRTVRSA